MQHASYSKPRIRSLLTDNPLFLLTLSLSLFEGVACDGNQSDNSTRPVETSRPGLTLMEFRDSQSGMLQQTAPFPSGWKIDTNPNDQLFMTGPDQTEVFISNSGIFAYSDDPFARESAMMAGAQVAPTMPVEQYLQQHVAPSMSQRGFRIVETYPLPKILKFWELFAASMPQNLSRRFISVIGADWENSNGTKACTILVMSVFQQPTFTSWNVQANELYAPSATFEKAKDDYLYAAGHAQLNPQWLITQNQKLLRNIQRDQQITNEYMRQSRIQHINRMNAILARGETSSSIPKINSDILDISHSGYLKRSDMVSAGQARTVNAISEQSVISNPNTGELYQVQSGPGNYWVNGQGEYFRTEDQLYDPRRDNGLNHHEWTQFEVMR